MSGAKRWIAVCLNATGRARWGASDERVMECFARLDARHEWCGPEFATWFDSRGQAIDVLVASRLDPADFDPFIIRVPVGAGAIVLEPTTWFAR